MRTQTAARSRCRLFCAFDGLGDGVIPQTGEANHRAVCGDGASTDVRKSLIVRPNTA